VEKAMIRKEEALDYVRSRDFDVLIVLGAGDLDNLTGEMAEILKGK
jgi:UDP-N-acetylmuramate--alanine ligase